MEVNTLDYNLGTTSSVLKYFIGPSFTEVFYPRSTNGVMVGDSFFLLIGSRKFVFNFCLMSSNIVLFYFLKLEGMIIVHCTNYEWCR